MTVDQFVSKWLGKKIDFDGAYAGQCVDLFRQYNAEVLVIQQPKGVTGAADFWSNYDSDPNLKNNFDKIPNTPTGVPEKGDVVIWNKKAGGGFGHIAVYLSGNADSFTSFDQNWPTLSVCTKTQHTYTNVYGWLRRKPTGATYKGIDLSNTDSVKVCVDVWSDVIEGKYVKKEELEKCQAEKAAAEEEAGKQKSMANELAVELSGERKALESTKREYQSAIDQIASAVGSTADLPGILKFVEINSEEMENARKKAKELEQNLTDAQEAKQKEINDLKVEIEELRTANTKQAAHIEKLETRINSLELNTETLQPIWNRIFDVINSVLIKRKD